jgi:hypothetical protein
MPSPSELAEASDCQRCRSYFRKRGRVCAHCRLEETVVAYSNKLYAFKSKRMLMVSLVGTGMTATTSISTSASTSGKDSKQTAGAAAGKKAGTSKGKGKGKGAVLGQGVANGVVEDSAFDLTERGMERVDGAFPMVRERWGVREKD